MSDKNTAWEVSTQPPTVACEMEVQLEQIHIACTFLNVFWRRFACSVGALATKFLHRSSVRTLLRVRCRLGSHKLTTYTYTSNMFLPPHWLRTNVLPYLSGISTVHSDVVHRKDFQFFFTALQKISSRSVNKRGKKKVWEMAGWRPDQDWK